MTPAMTAADYDFADFPAGFTQATQYPPGDMDAQDYAIPVSFEAYTLFWNMDIVDEYLDGVVPDTMGRLDRGGAQHQRGQRRRGCGRGHARHPLPHHHGHRHRHGLQQLGRSGRCRCRTMSGLMATGPPRS